MVVVGVGGDGGGRDGGGGGSSSSSSSSRFVERITRTPLMRYMFHCVANRRVFNADLTL